MELLYPKQPQLFLCQYSNLCMFELLYYLKVVDVTTVNT